MKSAVGTTIWKFCICTDSGFSLKSEPPRTEGSSSRTGFVSNFIALCAALPAKNLRAVGDESGGDTRVRENAESARLLCTRLTVDGDIKPDGRETSESDANWLKKKKKEQQKATV